MPKKFHALRRSTTLALLALVPVAAAAATRAEVADVRAGGDGVVWQPQIADYDRLTLIVAGPGGRMTQEFRAGEAPAFSLYDAAGGLVADGLYKWELRVTPRLDVATQRAIEAERESGGARRILGQLRASGALPATYQSGSFSVVEGALAMPGDLQESPGIRSEAAPVRSIAAPATVLTTNDGVIIQSLCVGIDCPNSPSFGDTTIMMMENNTRIKFDDTSNSASFPNNDWEIEANSNLNGGANYLGFNDCGVSNQGGCATDLVFAVEAGVRQNALYVESDGDIGLGTSNPAVNLHVVDGNTPTLRLEQDGSNGFTPQIWDLAGNEASFFVRDVTNGSTLPFRIEPGTASSMVYLDSNERVGIGTSAPSDMLHVRSTTGTASVLVEEASATAATRTVMTARNNGQTRFVIHNTAATVPAAGGYFFAQFDNGRFVIRPNGGGTGFFMDDNGNITAEANLTVNGTFSNPSSRTLKENFQPLDPRQVLARFLDLPITEWSYMGEQMRHVGPVTEDFQAAFGLGTKGTHIIPLDVQGVTMAALQGLYQVVETRDAELQRENDELRRENAELAARLAALERLVRELAD
jgi:hypothetical protein